MKESITTSSDIYDMSLCTIACQFKNILKDMYDKRDEMYDLVKRNQRDERDGVYKDQNWNNILYEIASDITLYINRFTAKTFQEVIHAKA